MFEAFQFDFIQLFENKAIGYIKLWDWYVTLRPADQQLEEVMLYGRSNEVFSGK